MSEVAENQASQSSQSTSSDNTHAFYERLPKLWPIHEIEQNLRITKQGVFVEENAVGKLIEAYQRWQQEAAHAQEKRSEDKVRKRLFGPEKPKLHYLLDGKRCLAGYLLLGASPDSRASRIPIYQANLLDPKESLHHRDVILQNTPGVKSRLTQQEGFVVEFHTSAMRYDATEEALKDFAHVARDSHLLLREYPELRGPLRDALKPFLQVLEHIKPLPQNQRSLVPGRYRTDSGVRFFKYRSIIFIVEGDKKVLTCYDSKGRGLGRFIRKELAKLGTQGGTLPGTQLIRGFEATNSKVQYLGRVWTKGMSFHLHARTFLLFYRELFRSDAAPKNFGMKISVRDIVERLVSLFQGAQPIEELALLPYIGKRRRPFAKYRRNSRWIFVMTDKNVISSCFEVPELAGPENRAPREGRPNQENRSRDGKPKGRHRHRRGHGGKGRGPGGGPGRGNGDRNQSPRNRREKSKEQK